MNTTVNVNLAGQHFYFDQAAKVKLEVYFEEIKSYFTDESFLQELMTDVEARIAELLNDIIADSQQVVTIQHIEKVIEVMGEPNSFKIDDDKAQNKTEAKVPPILSLLSLFPDIWLINLFLEVPIKIGNPRL